MGKRILITGANSYIGTSFEKWLTRFPNEYEVDTVDMLGGSWREKSFTGFDTVFHVAGIAHADTSKASAETKELYYKINRDLAIETARKAKEDNVKQFVFMSSIIVYGSKNAMIDKDTVPQPDNFYGDSKLQAEEGLAELENSSFRITVIRPPMVYGRGSKGNFPRLVRLARKTPVFPDYPNKRSMIYIENLCAFIKQVIDSNSSGMHLPQNKSHVNTTELVRCIADACSKKVATTKLLNPIISLTKGFAGPVSKLFGDLAYACTGDEEEYNDVGFEESIRRSVCKDE